MEQLIPNSDTRPIPFMMVQSTDHLTPLAGAAPTVTISKNGAGFAAPAGIVAEIGNGWYKLTPTSADTGTNGMLLLHATATGGDPTDESAQVVAFSPYDAVRLGLSALPGASAAAAGGLPTVGTGAGQINVDGAGGVTVGGYESGKDPATLILDAAASAHGVAGSIGADIALAAAGGGSGITPAEVTAAVWDVAASAHDAAGTPGAALGNLVNALTESYAANGQPATLAQLLYGILAILANVSQSGTVITATKLDGATPAMSFALDSATAPTSRKRAA
jgi:hypothetical protein